MAVFVFLGEAHFLTMNNEVGHEEHACQFFFLQLVFCDGAKVVARKKTLTWDFLELSALFDYVWQSVPKAMSYGFQNKASVMDVSPMMM